MRKPRTEADGPAVYRFFNAAGDLLYIGSTFDLAKRLTWHRTNQPWGHEVTRVESAPYPDLESARAAESAAILATLPVHNVYGKISPEQAQEARRGRRGNRPLEIRMPAETRQELQRIAASIGTTVPDVVRQFLDWYVGVPGATLPERPEVTRHDLPREATNRKVG